MRLYSVAIASLAVGAPVKWTDNLLAHHQIPEVRSRSRGSARGVTWAALVRIALVRELHVRIGSGIREAVALADSLIRASGTVSLGERLSLRVELTELERDLRQRLADALESAPRPRRGRPPRNPAAARSG